LLFASFALVFLTQKLLDSLPCVPFEARRVVVELFANWREVSTPYSSFPVGGHIKQISIVRRVLPLCKHALAWPLNLTTVDDALHNCCSKGAASAAKVFVSCWLAGLGARQKYLTAGYKRARESRLSIPVLTRVRWIHQIAYRFNFRRPMGHPLKPMRETTEFCVAAVQHVQPINRDFAGSQIPVD
jgi:hypothetical protein